LLVAVDLFFSFFFPKDISLSLEVEEESKRSRLRPAWVFLLENLLRWCKRERGGEDTRLPTKQTRTQVRSLVVGSCLLLLSRLKKTNVGKEKGMEKS
jgi:hypothetical protein